MRSKLDIYGVSAEVAGHGGVYCERNTERNTKKHPEIVLPPRKKLFCKAVLQATEDGSSLGRRRAGPGPCHGKKLLPSRYTVAQSVATCLLARQITPSVPRHAIGMPSASRHITKKRGGGVGGAEGLEYASTETEAATDCRYLDYDSNPAISRCAMGGTCGKCTFRILPVEYIRIYGFYRWILPVEYCVKPLSTYGGF